ncbi:MAG: SagB/ThcOx family dehydrogenase [Bacillota bacterium]|nr:SagB/ThcOx family dehydrogenase [Bacillota bacterium]MDI7249479.1 SagB/ThcOx family dehydrogenase [Bacillota bacterium]
MGGTMPGPVLFRGLAGVLLAVALVGVLAAGSSCNSGGSTGREGSGPPPGEKGEPSRGGMGFIDLPRPMTRGQVSLEEALAERRCRREFSRKEVALAHLGQLLWAASGMPSAGTPSAAGTAGVQGDATTGATRTAPSAGAIYPLALYVVAGHVQRLDPGVYQYDAGAHALRRVLAGDVREELAAAALRQDWVRKAPLSVVIAADYPRIRERYGERGVRYALIEAGCVAQNIALQATALGLGTVVVGAFADEKVAGVLGAGEEPLLIIPVGP